MQAYVTIEGLLPLMAVGVAFVLLLITVLLVPGTSKPGWMVLRPGGMHWFSFLGSAAMSALIGWVWIFVGSARSDAEFQMRVAWWLSFIFGAGAVYAGLLVYRLRKLSLRMRGRTIAYDEDGRERRYAVEDFVAWRRRWRGDFQLLFKDGNVVALDPFARNSDEFMGRLYDEPLPEEH
jgi:hypothetical protein